MITWPMEERREGLEDGSLGKVLTVQHEDLVWLPSTSKTQNLEECNCDPRSRV